jgi:hypothetical protein
MGDGRDRRRITATLSGPHDFSSYSPWLMCAGAAEPGVRAGKSSAFNARVLAPDAIEVRYVIARLLHYRDKFRFTRNRLRRRRANPGALQIKKDEFFR